MKEFILTNWIPIIWILGVLIGWGWCSFEYGKASDYEKTSNGFAIIPFALLFWPFAIPMIPIVLFTTLCESLGERSNDSTHDQ